MIGIDDFDNGPRIAAAASAGAACYLLSMDTPINILDVVYDEDAEGGWLPNQVQHAIAQLSLLLGKPGKTLDGKDCLIPRDFEPEEAGVLDRALMLLYRKRKTMLAIDEFGYVTQIEALARLAATITKVARKYGIGLIAKIKIP